jgi:hypothetical protein
VDRRATCGPKRERLCERVETRGRTRQAAILPIIDAPGGPAPPLSFLRFGEAVFDSHERPGPPVGRLPSLRLHPSRNPPMVCR